MFTDIAGYTEQMSKDQDLAFILLEEKQSKFKPLIKDHNGTLIIDIGGLFYGKTHSNQYLQVI